ncbi:hypothetical protein [Pseudobutyrivibrio sp.]
MVYGTEIDFEGNEEVKILAAMRLIPTQGGCELLQLSMVDGTLYIVKGDKDDIEEYVYCIKMSEYVSFAFSSLEIIQIR